MDLQLNGKRAVVTGASSGIGLAVSQALAAEGVDLVMVARGAGQLREAAAAVHAASGRLAVPVVADTREDGEVRAMVSTAARELGGVDILVNAAASPASAGPVPAVADLTDEALRTQLETKVLGYLRCARAVAPYMAAQGWGRIVNISGLNARQAGSLVGSVRNVAVAAMTKNLADELGPQGINVTVVHPGVTVTERTPAMLRARADLAGTSVEDVAASLSAATGIGRLVTAAEVADVVVFLASPRGVAVNGDAVAAGGGTRGAIYY